MTKLVLKDVRLSYPSLWETELYNGADTGKYAATFLVPKHDDDGKENAQAKELKKAVTEAMKACGAKKDKTPLRDGDELDYDGYAGMWAIKANTKRRPVVINRDKTPIVEDDDILYAGCWVNASIEVYGMENQYGKRVGCQLNGIQFLKDGDSFGAGGNAADDFDSLDAESETDKDDFDPFT